MIQNSIYCFLSRSIKYAEHDLIRFDVKHTKTNSYTTSTALTRYEKLDPTKVVNNRYFQFTKDHSREYGLHQINSLVVDMNHINYSVKAADLEIWEKKDTLLVGGSKFVRVAMRFNQNKGIYMFHCHNLEHEDDGMMVNLEVI